MEEEGARGTFSGNDNLIVMVVTHLYIMVRIHPVLYLKWMNFILCK